MVKNAVGQDYAYLREGDLWSQVKAFEYEAPGIRQVLSQHFTALLMLAGWCVASAILAVSATRRLQV